MARTRPGYGFRVEVAREGDKTTTLIVTGDVSAYDAATFLSPAEGGVVTIATVTIAETGQKMSEGDLTQTEFDEVEQLAELQGERQ